MIRPTARGRADLGRSAVHLREIRHRWADLLDDLTVERVVAGLAELIAICEELAAEKRADPPR